MKTLIRIMSVSMLVAMSLTSSFAWEKPLNPDRFLSFGLNADWNNRDGGYGQLIDDANYLKWANIEEKTSMYQADVRWPISNNTTIEGRVRYSQEQSSFHSVDMDRADSELDERDGMGYGIGVRYYFNGK